MTGQVLSIILDLAVLIGLGFTIFYCLKLSRSMNNFRQHRQDMNKLIDRLSKNIDEALRAIDGLKLAGDRSGRDLQKIINESRAMADELQMINESGNNLASRLEKLADRNRLGTENFENIENLPVADNEPTPVWQGSKEKPAFFIHDREHSDAAPEQDEGDIPESLQSQAEKELLEALRKNKKSSGRGAF